MTAKPFLGRIAALERAFLRPHRHTMAIAVAALVCQSVVTLPIPWIQGLVIDRLIVGSFRQPLPTTWLLVWAAAIPLACVLGRAALGWIGGTMANGVSLEFVRGLTDSLHRKLQRLPLAWFDRQETGQLMARLTSDVGTLLIFLSASSLQLVADLILAAGIVVALALLSWPLAMLSLAVLPIFWLSHRWHAPRISTLARQVQERNSELYALISERLSAVRTLRASGCESEDMAALSSHLDAQVQTGRRSLAANSVQQLSAMLVGGMATGLVIGAAGVLIQTQWLSLGQAAAFVAYLALLYQPLIRLAQFYGGIAATCSAVERISEVLEAPEPMPRPQRSLPRVRGEIRFRNVSFRYLPGSRPALDRVNLRIEPGMTVGICGPSGAGKSTLLSLVPRLYELPAGCGRILLDGRDVRSFRPAELRRHVRYVPQQARLFEGTIRSNLTYAIDRTGERLMWQALECVDLADLVASLPLSLDAPVGERGTTLSGGQRQRLALARALIARPAVLLLDDCLSALDAETIAKVWRRIDAFRPKQTRLVASHDPYVLASADRLVVLDGGKCVNRVASR